MTKLRQILIATSFFLLTAASAVFGVVQGQENPQQWSVSDSAPSLPMRPSSVTILDTTAPQLAPPQAFDFNIFVAPYLSPAPTAPQQQPKSAGAPATPPAVTAPSKGKESNAFEFKVIVSNLLPIAPVGFKPVVTPSVVYSGNARPQTGQGPLVFMQDVSGFSAIQKFIDALSNPHSSTGPGTPRVPDDRSEYQYNSYLNKDYIILTKIRDLVSSTLSDLKVLNAADPTGNAGLATQRGQVGIASADLLLSQTQDAHNFMSALLSKGDTVRIPFIGQNIEKIISTEEALLNRMAGLQLPSEYADPAASDSMRKIKASWDELQKLASNKIDANEKFLKDRAANKRKEQGLAPQSGGTEVAGGGTTPAGSLNYFNSNVLVSPVVPAPALVVSLTETRVAVGGAGNTLSFYAVDTNGQPIVAAPVPTQVVSIQVANSPCPVQLTQEVQLQISKLRSQLDSTSAVYPDALALPVIIVANGKTMNINDAVNGLINAGLVEKKLTTDELDTVRRVITSQINSLEMYGGVIEVDGQNYSCPKLGEQTTPSGPSAGSVMLQPIVSAPVVSSVTAASSIFDRVRAFFGFPPQIQPVAPSVAIIPPVTPQEIAAAQVFAAVMVPIVSDLKDKTVALGDELAKDVLRPFNDEKVLAKIVFAPFFAKPKVGGGLCVFDSGALDEAISKLEAQIKQLEDSIKNSSADFDRISAQKLLVDLKIKLDAKKIAKDLSSKACAHKLSVEDVCKATRAFVSGQILPKLQEELASVKNDDEDALGKRVLLKGLIKGVEEYRDNCAEKIVGAPKSLTDVLNQLVKLWGGRAGQALRDRGLFDSFGSLDTLLSEFSLDLGYYLPNLLETLKGAGAGNDAEKTAAQAAVDKIAVSAPLLVPPVDKSIELLEGKVLDFWGCMQSPDETFINKLLGSLGLSKSEQQKRDVELALRAVIYDSVRKIVTEQLAQLIGSLGGVSVGAPMPGTGPFNLADAQDLESASNGDVNALGRLATRAASGQSGEGKAKAVVKVRVMVEFLKNLKGFKYSCGVKSNLAEAFKAAVDAVNNNPTAGLDFMLESINVNAGYVKLFGIPELNLTGNTEVAKTFNAMEAIDHMIDTVEGKGLDAVRNVKVALDAMEQKQQALAGSAGSPQAGK